MNQILITKKLYITPELKRKKKIYKFDFILSIFLACVLFSFYIYAEYDRNKSEEVSQDILQSMETANEQEDTTTIQMKDNVLVVALDGYDEEVQEIQEEKSNNNSNSSEQKQSLSGRYVDSNGNIYSSVAVINIPKIGVNYPVLAETSEALLKVAPCKFWGPDPNEVGNFCIVGHNYRNKKFFSKVINLVVGDKIEITDLSGRTLTYQVYDKYTVNPEDVKCTSQLTNGKKEVTLITCTNDSKQRVVVKSREI